MHAAFGIAAAVVSFLAFVPYIVATLKGRNRPNRATWIIWTAVGVSLLASYAAAGARETLWLSVGNLIAFVAVLILSVRYGEGGWTRFDAACLAGAAFGFFLWWWFDSPLPTLFTGLFVDLVGALPTVRKVWKDPGSEDGLTWVLFVVANVLNLFALETWDLAMAAYPVYMVFVTVLIAGTIFMKRFKFQVSGSRFQEGTVKETVQETVQETMKEEL